MGRLINNLLVFETSKCALMTDDAWKKTGMFCLVKIDVICTSVCQMQPLPFATT